MSEFKIRKLDDDYEILPSYGPRYAGLWVDKDTLSVMVNPDGTPYTVASKALQAVGSTKTMTAAESGRTFALDQAAGCTVTLPAATGSGTKFFFIVTVKPTSNQHRINVTGNDEFVGSYNILDRDLTPQAAYGAIDGGDNDQFNMNGSTQGGLQGDWVEVIDIAADTWFIRGQGQCPAGSNIATPFATGQVS